MTQVTQQLPVSKASYNFEETLTRIWLASDDELDQPKVWKFTYDVRGSEAIEASSTPYFTHIDSNAQFLEHVRGMKGSTIHQWFIARKCGSGRL